MSKLIKLYCKNCGTELEISDDREFCYCMYCGTKMLIPADRKFIRIKKDVNVNINKKTRNIDEYIDRGKLSDNFSDNLAMTFIFILVLVAIGCGVWVMTL